MCIQRGLSLQLRCDVTRKLEIIEIIERKKQRKKILCCLSLYLGNGSFRCRWLREGEVRRRGSLIIFFFVGVRTQVVQLWSWNQSFHFKNLFLCLSVLFSFFFLGFVFQCVFFGCLGFNGGWVYESGMRCFARSVMAFRFGFVLLCILLCLAFGSVVSDDGEFLLGC